MDFCRIAVGDVFVFGNYVTKQWWNYVTFLSVEVWFGGWRRETGKVKTQSENSKAAALQEQKRI